jgi:hypothetical protein
MPTTSLLSAAGAVLAAAAIAACGSSASGIASKSATQIIRSSTATMDSLRFAHASGAGTLNGTSGQLDLYLTNGRGGKGTIIEAGNSIQVIDIGRDVYIRAGSGFWTAQAGAAVARRLSGRWLKAPATGQLAEVAALTNVHTFFDQLLASHGKLAKGAITTVAGHRAIAIRDTTKGGTAYVAASGPPYLLEIVNPAKHESVTFDQFNRPVSLAPPPGALDLTGLIG